MTTAPKLSKAQWYALAHAATVDVFETWRGSYKTLRVLLNQGYLERPDQTSMDWQITKAGRIQLRNMPPDIKEAIMHTSVAAKVFAEPD